MFFSSLVPCFLAGCTASFLSISTYFSTLAQIPNVIREKDPRYINMPIVIVSLINATVWTAYAVLKKDIPLFMTNVMALCFMSINMTFYLWAVDAVATNSVQTLISFFQVAFPEEEAKFDDDEICERRLDAETSDGDYRTKAEI